jgi:hypothetical protein
MWYKEERRGGGIEQEKGTEEESILWILGFYKESWEGNIMERRKYRIPICTWTARAKLVTASDIAQT